MKRPKTFGMVHPSSAIRNEYEGELKNLICQMIKELDGRIKTDYSTVVARASDENTAKAMNDAINQIERKYNKKFAQLSKTTARKFADSILYQSDMALQKILNRANLRVKFQLTKPMREIIESVVSENVNLIKSIPAEFFTDIKSIVNVGVQNGRDQQFIYENIKTKYQITNRRARLIARDQTNKATAALTRTRQRDIGIKKGIWQHSHAGEVPRKSHLAADGKEFDLDKGLYLDDVWTLPAQQINCRCTWRPVIDVESLG